MPKINIRAGVTMTRPYLGHCPRVPTRVVGLALPPSRHPGDLDAGIGQLWMAPRDERKSLIGRYPPNCIKLLILRKPAGDSQGTKQDELTDAPDNATAGIACL